MRTNFNILAFIVAALSLASCMKPVKLNLDFSNMFSTCKKAETDQTITGQAVENTFTFAGNIGSQDTQFTDCNDKPTTFVPRMPVKVYSEYFKVDAPKELTGNVSFVSYENPRTCAKVTHTVSDEPIKTSYVAITDSTTILAGIFGQVNVADGANAIKIRYYGKCQIYRDNKVTGHLEDCLKADLLGQKDVLVRLNMTRPFLPGTRTVRECSKNNKP